MKGQATTWILAGALLVTACASDSATSSSETTAATTTTTTEPAPRYTSEIYADPAHWLCLPWRDDDACDVDLDATRIDPDGTRTVERFVPADDPPIDCFYVYPTVSDDPTPNSDLEPSDAERRVVFAQAARFGGSCRVFAPVYRQITRSALVGDADGIADRALAYNDVVDAWSHYLAHHNQGRGVVLVGHSQGAGHLRELLSRRVDTDPVERDLLVSAILLGTTVRTPLDAEAGAHFDHLAPCRSRDQFGCIISFSSYPNDEPPGDIGFFAGVRDTDDERAVCTNPAALDGGEAPLDTVIPTNPRRDGEVSTPFVRYVGLARAECVQAGIFHYLEVRYPDSDVVGWPSELGARVTPQWGLHLIDGNIALGDLVALVADQGRAHATR